MEVVEAYLLISQDRALYEYYRRHYAHFFPALSQLHRSSFVRQAANWWALEELCWLRGTSVQRKGPLRSDLPRRKGEGMTSGKEHYSWRRDAVLPCESAPGLICEVLETEPACEKATLHVPDHASWDVEAKDGGLDGLRSPFTNCSIVSYSTNRLTETDGFR